MSGTTIEARVRAGTAIAAELAALRSQLEGTIELRVQQALGARTATGGSRVVTGSRSVRVGHAAAPRAVAADRVATREQIRAHDERVLADRARELVFARMLERLPEGTVVQRTAVAAGGTRQAVIAVAGGGEVTLAVDDRGRADLLMDRCELAELDGPAGTVAGCDAEAELGRRFHESWRESGLEVEADEPSGGGEERALGAGA